MVHVSGPLPYRAPFSLWIKSSIQIGHTAFPLSIFSRTMSHLFHLPISLSPKIILAKATSWHLFQLILSPSQQDISQGFLVTFSLKTPNFVSQFSFWFQTVSFSVPIHQWTSKMSYYSISWAQSNVPSTSPLSPKSISQIYLLDQGSLNCFISSLYDIHF